MAVLPLHRRPAADVPRPGGLRRNLRRLVGFAAAVLVAGGLLATPAQADPSVEEIEAKITEQWNKLEPTVEDYNRVRSELKVNREKAKKLEKRMQPLELQSELAMGRINTIAARYYMTGTGSSTAYIGSLLASGKPGQLAEQMALLDHLAAGERDEISKVLATLEKYGKKKKELDDLIVTQDKQQKHLASQRKEINAEIKRLQASLPKSVVKAQGCPTITGVLSEKANIAVSTACAQVGKPYVWGATGPSSYDCSGLTQYAWAAAGVYLTHYTGSQWNEGRQISHGDARPGDLVFFPDHVGIYIGNDQMVHAPQPGQSVGVASIYNVGKPVTGFVRPG